MEKKPEYTYRVRAGPLKNGAHKVRGYLLAFNRGKYTVVASQVRAFSNERAAERAAEAMRRGFKRQIANM